MDNLYVLFQHELKTTNDRPLAMCRVFAHQIAIRDRSTEDYLNNWRQLKAENKALSDEIEKLKARLHKLETRGEDA